MTGEITLRGKVLPIGGLKEKLLAAHRARDLRGDPAAGTTKRICRTFPENIRKEMKLHFVESMDEVLKIALETEITALPLGTAAAPDDGRADERESRAQRVALAGD